MDKFLKIMSESMPNFEHYMTLQEVTIRGLFDHTELFMLFFDLDQLLPGRYPLHLQHTLFDQFGLTGQHNIIDLMLSA